MSERVAPHPPGRAPWDPAVGGAPGYPAAFAPVPDDERAQPDRAVAPVSDTDLAAPRPVGVDDDIAVSVRGLTKVYRGGLFGKAEAVPALAGVDLDVRRGTVHALLGPNGAGKTTIVRIISTLLRPDSGSVTVLGVDGLADPVSVRGAIGVSGQYAAVDANLTALENLRMVGRLYGLNRLAADVRARELLSDFDLTDVADRPTRTFSGGMRRRIDLAGALVARPGLVILDEPTTGLDPRGRRDMWALINELVGVGTTVLLTTQYLEEADTLADEITVIDKGTVIARGTAHELKSTITQASLTVAVAREADRRTVIGVLESIGTGPVTAHPEHAQYVVAVDDGTRSSARAVAELTAAGVTVIDAQVSAPTLDDVFLTLTASTDDDPDTREGDPT